MNRIPRLVMSKTLVGIDKDYALRELDADMRDHGGFNYTYVCICHVFTSLTHRIALSQTLVCRPRVLSRTL